MKLSGSNINVILLISIFILGTRPLLNLPFSYLYFCIVSLVLFCRFNKIKKTPLYFLFILVFSFLASLLTLDFVSKARSAYLFLPPISLLLASSNLPFNSKSPFLPSFTSIDRFFGLFVYMQFFIQLFQALTTFAGLNLSNLWVHIVPSSSYADTVFVQNGLARLRFSGLFNQPAEAGICALILFTYLLIKYINNQSKIILSDVKIYILLLSCILAGTKVVILLLLSLAIYSLWLALNLRLSAFKVKTTKKFLTTFVSFFVVLLIALSFFNFESFIAYNPTANTLFNNPINFFDLNNVTSGRLSLDGNDIRQYYNLSVSFVGSNNARPLYDNGYLYLIHDAGLIGLLIFSGIFMYIVLSIYRVFVRYSRFSKSLLIVLALSTINFALVFISCYMLTSPKASTLLYFFCLFLLNIDNYLRTPDFG